MTEETQEYWSIDELVSLTDEVQEKEIEFREKLVKFQWCELAESEEPKVLMVDDKMPDEEKNEKYMAIGWERNNEDYNHTPLNSEFYLMDSEDSYQFLLDKGVLK